MNLCEETDPKPITRNKRGVELGGEALLIGHKGSSYQTKTAAVRTADEWRSEQKKKTTYACNIMTDG